MSNVLISRIRVNKLFGLYTYSLPSASEFSNAAILYGDNGVGKSTILRLAFHLISAATDRGHRTALYEAKFESLELDLSNGFTLSAKQRPKNDYVILELSILEFGKLKAFWEFVPRNKRRLMTLSGEEIELELEDSELKKAMSHYHFYRVNESSPQHLEKQYFSQLKAIAPTTYILNADRRLDSDSVADPSDEVELRSVMKYEDSKKINDLVTRSREIALTQALSAASKWIGKKAVQSANKGTENVHTVYGSVLKHLITPPAIFTDNKNTSNPSELITRLNDIEQETSEYSKYELATPLVTTEFKKALNHRSALKKKLSSDLLTPYIESLESRLKAVEPIYKVIHKFIETINLMLSDKSIAFTVSQGFSFRNRNGEILGPGQLSSGEQQLLLLFCYIMVARETPSVFMIDEPEISLNIKWQRQLVKSLLDITDGSRIQFIFASHSLELLAQHRERVVKLEAFYE